MSNVNAKTLTAIRHAGKTYQILNRKTATAKSVVVDMLFQNKVPEGFNKKIELEDSSKVYTPEAESLRNGVAEGMGKMAYYVFTADPKDLTKDQMTARRGVIGNVGSVMSKFNNALAERYDPKAKQKGADQNKTDDFTKLLELATTSLKRLEKSEDMPCDVIKAIEALGVYIAILNTKI
tara:strand:- start:99 stop:635 length:537 start_codon:yes stop_codon:yes gene_type:complete